MKTDVDKVVDALLEDDLRFLLMTCRYDYGEKKWKNQITPIHASSFYEAVVVAFVRRYIGLPGPLSWDSQFKDDVLEYFEYSHEDFAEPFFNSIVHSKTSVVHANEPDLVAIGEEPRYVVSSSREKLKNYFWNNFVE